MGGGANAAPGLLASPRAASPKIADDPLGAKPSSTSLSSSPPPGLLRPGGAQDERAVEDLARSGAGLNNFEGLAQIPRGAAQEPHLKICVDSPESRKTPRPLQKCAAPPGWQGEGCVGYILDCAFLEGCRYTTG